MEEKAMQKTQVFNVIILDRSGSMESIRAAAVDGFNETLAGIKKKFGKNAILNGGSYLDGATAKERNKQIGGHKA